MRKQTIFSILIILTIVSMLDIVSAGEGGGAVPVTTVDLTEQGNSYSMKPGRLTFEFNNKLYAIQVRRVKQEYINFLVMTLNMDKPDDIMAYTLDNSFNLSTGEKKEIDLDKDGTKDIRVELNEIISTGEHNSIRSADFSIEKIVNTKKAEASNENIEMSMEATNSDETIEKHIEVQQNLSSNIINDSAIKETLSESVIVLNQRSQEQLSFFGSIIIFFKELFS